MKKTLLLLCLLVCLLANAQKEKAEAYINTYRELAIEEMIRTGVPASITLAQGILESQSGESDLAKTSNNHFGIKCKTEWTGPKTYHDDDEKGECFRVYASVADSYKDHSDFLKTRPNYAPLFKLDPTDYEGWAYGLKKAGYATSPTYPQKLLKLIDDYNLEQVSLDALARLNKTSPGNNTQTTPIAATPVEIKTDEETPKAVLTSTAITEPEEKTNLNTEEVNTKPEAVKKTASYPGGVFTINHCKVIYASRGTSMLALANQYGISLHNLINYNDLPEMDLLDTDRLIFIEKKLKKGASDYHTVADVETLHDICQTEGVRLESILSYNRLSKTSAPSSGSRVYLRQVSKTAPSK